MSFFTKYRIPVRSDYDTDEEYKAALDAYEDAEYLALEQDMERHRDNR